MMVFALMLGALMLLMTIVGDRLAQYRETIADQQFWIENLEQTVAFKMQTIAQLDAIINRLEEEKQQLVQGHINNV